MSARPAVPTDPGAYAPADVRLVVADMDGTLLDDRKRFPGGLWRMLDQLDARGATFAPASGRQVWTLLDMFPDRPGMTVIGENGAIVMRDGAEISSSPLDLPTLREAVRRINETYPECCTYVERVDEPFVAGVVPYYHRTRQVDSQLDVLDAIEAGELDDAIVKLAVHSLDPVGPLAEATLARFRLTHQYAVSGANWADLQIRGVDKGRAVRALQGALGVTRAQTAVFGDFHNDLSMLAEADLSFAVANADPDVVRAARFVAPSNNEGGVVSVVERLFSL